MMRTTTQGIKLDALTAQRLKSLGEARDRSPHWLMRTAIERYLDQEEAFEREKQEDLARWEQYMLTGLSVPHDQVLQWLDQLAHGDAAPPPSAV